MTNIHLKKKIKNRLEKGHPWVYGNEIESVEGRYTPGDIVNVYDAKKQFVGKGYINPNSLIRVRLMSRDRDEVIDYDFIKRKIEQAWTYRKQVADEQSCRLVYGEADGLPGLIVDKFNDILSMQTLTLGIERFKDDIVRALIEVVHPRGIYERNDASVRTLEGLPEMKGVLYGSFDPHTVISENGVKMLVDIENGQKTGYFLDQKENRAALRPIVKDADVLDCFTHTGSFALHAAVFGAKSVEAVDISEHAIQTARENARLNGVEDRMTFTVANAFDLLKEYQEGGRMYDVVILDPPAFTKSARKIDSASRGYKEINLRGFRMVRPGGFLVTASCSHYMSPEIFTEVLMDAARDAGRVVQVMEYRTQAKDHPVLWNYEESLYLKFYILRVL